MARVGATERGATWSVYNIAYYYYGKTSNITINYHV